MTKAKEPIIDSTLPSKPMIYWQIAKAMADVEAITKNRKNTSQGYQFRGIDDVYAELHPIFAKHQIFTLPTILSERTEDRTSRGGAGLIYRVLHIKYTFYAVDGSSIETSVIGEGMDSGDKAANKAMAVAHKYALLQAFCIPTEDPKDPENDSPNVASKEEPKKNEKDKATGFDINNPKHRAYLMTTCEAMGLRNDLEEQVAIKMKGRPGSDMKSVIEEVMLDDIPFKQ